MKQCGFFYLMFLNIGYWEKLTFSKLVGKVNFFKRKFGEMHQLWRAKRYKVYSGKRLFWHYYIQLSFVYIPFKLFCSGNFYQSSLGNEVGFRDIMNVSPNISTKNWNLKKLRHGFVDESALITITLKPSCHWKTLVPFYLQMKRPENEFLTLIVNYRKNGTEKQIMLLKTTVNCLLNDKWCYLVIGCFDWKIGVFQQTVVRGLLHP